ncbi:serine carboxypeptidase-like [Tripterygium wilfordii]|uniref:serine carboxypeptidase-like n=1 Tax=Tripterygium wilfordii TaxID=458696 RepID=UPI0018F84A43|nr:serine carboxypeptidase-like [Tripterygium wilfordii]
MSTTFVNILLSLSLFDFFFTSSFAYSNRHFLSSTTTISPTQKAEMLITSPNLFSKDNSSIIKDNPLVHDVPRLVEKKLKFPLLYDDPSIEDLGDYAGYYSLPHTVGARMFYFFFESRNSENDPVVIWLSGGPGASCAIALFYENGPFHIKDNISLKWNDYGWEKASNIIYVDQPTGTGFSYTTDYQKDIRHNLIGVSNDLYYFLQEFFMAHPQFVQNDFFITGQSYAGHYAPALASRICQGNKKGQDIHINLKGLAIGNGLTNLKIQYQELPEYAYKQESLIEESDYIRIKELVPKCESSIDACVITGREDPCIAAYVACDRILNEIIAAAGNINYYDIRKKSVGSLNYDFSNLENFLNMQSVKEALGVGDISFVLSNTMVFDALIREWAKNFAVGIPKLLSDGIKVLIYAGDQDLMCNWVGNLRWVSKMKWYGREEFEKVSRVSFVVDGEEAGLVRNYGPLTFIKVYKAGHLVPMDQPKIALRMIQNWMTGNLIH